MPLPTLSHIPTSQSSTWNTVLSSNSLHQPLGLHAGATTLASTKRKTIPSTHLLLKEWGYYPSCCSFRSGTSKVSLPAQNPSIPTCFRIELKVCPLRACVTCDFYLSCLSPPAKLCYSHTRIIYSYSLPTLFRPSSLHLPDWPKTNSFLSTSSTKSRSF